MFVSCSFVKVQLSIYPIRPYKETRTIHRDASVISYKLEGRFNSPGHLYLLNSPKTTIIKIEESTAKIKRIIRKHIEPNSS